MVLINRLFENMQIKWAKYAHKCANKVKLCRKICKKIIKLSLFLKKYSNFPLFFLPILRKFGKNKKIASPLNHDL